jgi:hypothetical protein
MDPDPGGPKTCGSGSGTLGLTEDCHTKLKSHLTWLRWSTKYELSVVQSLKERKALNININMTRQLKRGGFEI